MPWGELSAYDARRLKRAMLIAYIGDQAKQANDFLGLFTDEGVEVVGASLPG